MQFVVPQFIDVEDKIIGPVNTRQFIIMLAAAVIIFVEYKLSDFALFILECVLTGGLAIVLAFVKINGQPFHYFLLNIVQTFKRPKLKLWDKELSDKELRLIYEVEKKQKKEGEPVGPPPVKKPVSSSRLSELSLVVDTGGVYQGEK